jgi:hypothetical protein
MKIDRLEELNNELSGLLNQQVDDHQKTRLEHIKKIKSQIDMLKNAPPSTDRSDKAHEAISKVVQIIAILILFFNTSSGQAIFNGKKIHQLPSISSTQYDSTWLTIIGNPSTGTLFKLPLDSLLSGSTGSGGGATLDPVGAHTLYGNETGVSAYPHEISAAQTRTILALSTVATSGSYADLSNKPFIPEQPNFTAGSNVVFTGTYPNISISSSGGGSATWGFITGGNPLAQTDLAALFNSKEDAISTGTTSQYRRGDKTWQTLNKTAVGLANVDNVSDILKPLSNDAIFALSQKQDQLVSGTNIKKINNIDLVGSGNLTIGSGGTVTSFAKNTSKDSMIIVLGDGTRFAAKDSAGGGSQTLDQTLNLGNTTDTVMVFDPNPNATNYNFIKVNPIDTFSSQVPFRMFRWNSPQNSGAVAGNEGVIMGFNLDGGGGVIESGKPAIGFSIESNYLPDYITRYVEWHQIYIPSVSTAGLTAGSPVRLSSYTINTATNNIDLYRRVGREYLMPPDGSSTQYWLVQPGSFALQNEAATQGVSHEIAANRYTIAATGADTTMAIQGFDFVNFGGATLTNFVFPGALTISNPTLSDVVNVLDIIRFKDVTTPTKYMAFEPNGVSNIMSVNMYGGMNRLNFGGADFFKFTFSDSYIQFDHEDIYFQGANTKFVYTDDLKGILGVNSSFRWKEAWVKDGYFNQITINQSTIDASAVMDIVSTTKGFLPPRMTTTQKNAISSPAEGLMVYDTTLHKLCIYTGSAWETITSL